MLTIRQHILCQVHDTDRWHIIAVLNFSAASNFTVESARARARVCKVVTAQCNKLHRMQFPYVHALEQYTERRGRTCSESYLRCTGVCSALLAPIDTTPTGPCKPRPNMHLN